MILYLDDSFSGTHPALPVPGLPGQWRSATCHGHGCCTMGLQKGAPQRE